MNPNEKNKIHYIERLNKVFDYIDENIDAQLNLDDLAKVSHFSKFHFSRIFSALVGETPFKFIQRIRLERANYLLRLKPKAKITEIAFECGFNDLAVFSRQFTLHFNISPTAFKKQNIQQSNIHQTSSFKAKYFCSELKIYRDMEQLVEANIRSLPEKTIAYIKHIGSYRQNADIYEKLFNQLYDWAGKNSLLKHHPESISIHYDDPEITPEDKQRMNVCITVPEDTEVNGSIWKTTIPSGKYYVAKFKLKPQEIPMAWNWIYGEGIPSIGYHPIDKIPYQVYPEPPKEGILTIVFCIPVKKN